MAFKRIGAPENPRSPTRPSVAPSGDFFGSAREGNADEFFLSPDQPTLASGSEAVKGQLEIERHDLQIWCAYTGT